MVDGRVVRQAQDPFGDEVALDLVAAAADGVDERPHRFLVGVIALLRAAAPTSIDSGPSSWVWMRAEPCSTADMASFSTVAMLMSDSPWARSAFHAPDPPQRMDAGDLLAHDRVGVAARLIGDRDQVGWAASGIVGLARPRPFSGAGLRMPPPIIIRSTARAVCRTRQPSLSALMRRESATRALVKNTSLKLAWPVICLMGRTSTPSWPMGSRK